MGLFALAAWPADAGPAQGGRGPAGARPYGLRGQGSGFPGQGRGPIRAGLYPLRLPDSTTANPIELTCAPALVDMGDGTLRGVLAYNGQFPGPVFTARTGDWITATLVNELDEDTITHWHGLHLDFENDGGPRIHIAPGKTYDYKFQIAKRASLNFYHPHPHGITGRQVCLGLAGPFIIRDDEEDALGLPSGAYEVPLVIRDASFNRDGSLHYNPAPHGFRGRFPLVNGTLNPGLEVDRGVYRFRILNAANARIFTLAFGNRAPFTLIGTDGGLLTAPVEMATVTLSPAERLDVLVDFSALGAGETVTLRCLSANWNLVQFVGTGQPGPSYSPPAVLSAIQPLTGPSEPTRTFSFDGTSRINGLQYDVDRLDFQVPFGVVERWRFTTRGNAPHPVHVHGTSFQVVARTGGRGQLFAWERGWKDTVLLNARETVDVLIRFDRYSGEYYGQYVMHCHLLEHEDMGMMTNFVVI